MAHFFVKGRRENASQPLPTALSPDDIVFNKQGNDQGFYSREESSDRLYTDESSTPATPTSINDIVSNADDLSSITQSKGDVSDDFYTRSNETSDTPTLITPIRPDDLSSLLELENPNDQSNAAKTRDGRLSDRLCYGLWMILDEIYARPASYAKRTSFSAVAVAAAVADDRNAETLDEMCETLILALVMIMWKGITDSDDASWMVRSYLSVARPPIIVYCDRHVIKSSRPFDTSIENMSCFDRWTFSNDASWNSV